MMRPGLIPSSFIRIVAVDREIARRERRALGEHLLDVRLERDERREVRLARRRALAAQVGLVERVEILDALRADARIQRRTAASVQSS